MKNKIIISLIIILALVHLALVIPAIAHPERFRYIDSDQYVDLANNLLKTGTFSGQIYPGIDLVRTPGYPALLAFTVLVFGDVRWVALLQVLLTFVNCFILYRIAADLERKSIGYAAIILYLISLNAAFESLLVMAETFTSFWLLLALWMLVRFWLNEKARYLFLSGLSLGFGALTRPIVAPLFYIWCLFLFLLWGWREKRFVVLKKDLKNLVIFVVAGLLLILSWQGRNYAVYHKFTLSPVADLTLRDILSIPIEDEYHITFDEAKTLIGSSPDPNAYALAFIKSHPIPFLRTQARGILMTLISVNYPTWAYEMTGIRPQSTGVVVDMSFNLSRLFTQINSGNTWILAGLVAVLYDLILFGLAIFTTLRTLTKESSRLVFKLVLILLLTVAYMVVPALAQGAGRFRIPVEPYLALLAGLAFYKPDMQTI